MTGRLETVTEELEAKRRREEVQRLLSSSVWYNICLSACLGIWGLTGLYIGKLIFSAM